MKRLVEEYKEKALKLESRAILAETQSQELQIELEVALKRVSIAENQLMSLRYLKSNTTEVTSSKA